jgi:hypothetical protein
MPAEVLASQPGHRREATRAPHSSAKSQCGEPPTASIPKTRDQPEAANLIPPPHYGNSGLTGISPVPLTHPATRASTNDTERIPHRAAPTTTTGTAIKHPVSLRTGQPHPAANPPVELLHRSCGSPNAAMALSPSAEYLPGQGLGFASPVAPTNRYGSDSLGTPHAASAASGKAILRRISWMQTMITHSQESAYGAEARAPARRASQRAWRHRRPRPPWTVPIPNP